VITEARTCQAEIKERYCKQSR